MSGQRRQPRPPSSPSMPPQPQPFRFWLPYRSNAAPSRHRQQPPPPSRPMPVSRRPQPPPPPPIPAERAPPGRAVEEEEDIPIQADSSDDQSDTIPVQSLESLRLRGARPSMADLELTLSGSPPTGQERSPRGGDGRGGNGTDTKISISGFPRSRLFDGARAPYKREIEDGLKSLAGRDAPAPRTDSGQGCRVITLAGHNVGASMVLGGGGGGTRDAPSPSPSAAEPAGTRPPVAANVNSNVQSVNNSTMEASTCNAGDPGVRLDIKNAREEPVVVAPWKEEEAAAKPNEPPPPQEKREAASGGEAARTPRARRCLRALMMESGREAEARRKARRAACRFQCVADHAPPATATEGGGGGGGKSADEGGKESTK